LVRCPTLQALVGMGKPDLSIPILSACCREVDIRGVFRYRNTYPAAMELAGSVDLTALITHRFPLESAVKAFDAFHSRDVDSLKIIIDCSDGAQQP
jgi:L-iditol 2-dehydrogenase